ncbi:MAG: hypothetical protein LBC65_01040 [Oscillospiraceae bacterium]|jgi:hypothetical protein|nr:hypothetical protein [Oscillospiraceae bacterium]
MLKRKLSVLLVAVLLFALSAPISAPAESVHLVGDPYPPVNGYASNQAVYVDGIAAPLKGYHVEGYNYFMLRELAVALNGTAAQFDVLFDQEISVIRLIPGEPYSGEVPTQEQYAEITVSPADQALFIGISRLSFATAVNVDDRNYFKLADLAELLGYVATYDEATRSVLIATYVGAPLPQFEDSPEEPSPSPQVTASPEPSPQVSDVIAESDPLNQLILQSLTALSTEIPVEEFKLVHSDADAQVFDRYWALIARHPELFYVKKHLGFTYYNSGAITLLKPEYSYSASKIPGMVETFNTELAKAYAAIPVMPTAREQVRAINDWICNHATYDNSLRRSTAYDLLVSRTGTCEAYTALFNLMATHYGITWRKLSSEPMEHAWSSVLIDGEWLHVDVTWNDGFAETGNPNNPFLLITDAQAINDQLDPHYDWVVESDAAA